MVGKLHTRTAGYSLLFSLSVVLLAARCDDNEVKFQFLTFELPMTITPSDSIVKIGDTLWVMADIPDSLLDFNTKKKFKVPNFDFGQTSLVIHELVDKTKSIIFQRSAALDFNNIAKVGVITFPGETFVDFTFQYDSDKNKYLLKLGFIPTKVGTYSFSFLAPKELLYKGIINLGEGSNGIKLSPVYQSLVFPINNGINNFELYRTNCLDVSDGPPEDYKKNYRYVTFTFRVK